LTAGVNSSYTEINRPDISLIFKNKIGLAVSKPNPQPKGSIMMNPAGKNPV